MFVFFIILKSVFTKIKNGKKVTIENQTGKGKGMKI